MAKDKKSFLMYCDWMELFNELPDEKAGQLIKHIFQYVNDLNPKTNDLVLKTSFSLIKQQLKRDLVKYEQLRTKNSENANKRWHPSASERIPNDAKHADTVNDTVTVKVTDTVKDNKSVYPFEEFWSDYDKKADRNKAKLKYKKVKESDRAKIKEYIPLYKTAEPDKQFRKNPATFLNNQSWLNEIPQPDENFWSK